MTWLEEKLQKVSYPSYYYRIIVKDPEQWFSKGQMGLFTGCGAIIDNVYDWLLESGDEDEADEIHDNLDETLSILERDLGYPPKELITKEVLFAYKEDTYNKYFHLFDEIDDILRSLDMGFSLEIKEVVPNKIIWEDEDQIAFI